MQAVFDDLLVLGLGLPLAALARTAFPDTHARCCLS